MNKIFIVISFKLLLFGLFLLPGCAVTLDSRMPYNTGLIVTVPENQTAITSAVEGLPVSGIFVIEQIGYTTSSLGDYRTVNFQIVTSLPNMIGMRNVLYVPSTADLSDRLTPRGSQSVRLYHDLSLGEPLEIIYARYPADQNVSLHVTISGYIVPKGSPSLAP